MNISLQKLLLIVLLLRATKGLRLHVYFQETDRARKLVEQPRTDYEEETVSIETVLKILGRRVQDVLCNKVTILGMVICPQFHTDVPVPSNSIVSDYEKAIKAAMATRKTHVPRPSMHYSTKQTKKYQSKLRSDLIIPPRNTITGIEEDVSEEEESYAYESYVRHDGKVACMEGKLIGKRKCLTYDPVPRTFLDAVQFCKGLSPGSKIWIPRMAAHLADTLLLQNDLVPMNYSTWINAKYLEHSVIGTGLFDAELSQRQVVKDVRGIPEHKAGVYLTVNFDLQEPFYKYASIDQAHPVICQSYPLQFNL